MNPQELSEQEIVRRGSMEEMRRLGIEPYPAAEYTVTGHADEIVANFADDAPQREVTIAGRVMSRRIMGKASFMEPSGCHRPHTGICQPRRDMPRRGQNDV